MVHLGKTKVMIFNWSKKTLYDHHFFLTYTYTYLGVLFTGPCFSLCHALQPRVNKGYGSLALLERQCFQNHFQDISSKMSLMNTLVWTTILYGSEVWGLGLLEFDWSLVERVQIILLYRIIRCKQIAPFGLRQCLVSSHSYTAFGVSLIQQRDETDILTWPTVHRSPLHSLVLGSFSMLVCQGLKSSSLCWHYSVEWINPLHLDIPLLHPTTFDLHGRR
jgi:hypothetical protein